MYQSFDRDKMFFEIAEHFPELLGCYLYFYEEPAPIILDRKNGQLIIEVTKKEFEDALDIDDAQEVGAGAPADDAKTFFKVLLPNETHRYFRRAFSHVGAQQGCSLATNGAMVTYHKSLRQVCNTHRSVVIVAEADDTYFFGPPEDIYNAYQLKAQLQGEAGFHSNAGKVLAYASSGDFSETPADLPRTSDGFKAVGAFHGNSDWCQAQVYGALMGFADEHGNIVKPGKLANLDRIDALKDTAFVHNSAQIKQYIIKSCASAKPEYMATTMRPSHTRPAMAAADARIAQSLESICEAHHSPPERRTLALQHQRLQLAMGGCGIRPNSALAPCTFAGSVARRWAKIRTLFPSLADIDISTSDLPFFVEFREKYTALCTRQAEIRDFYATLNTPESRYFDFDGRSKIKFCPKSLIPTKKLPSIASLADESSSPKPPAQRKLNSIVHHSNWVGLYQACRAADAKNDAAAAGDPNHISNREAIRLTSNGAEHSGVGGAWLSRRWRASRVTRSEAPRRVSVRLLPAPHIIRHVGEYSLVI